jgi:hypothetical protein
MKSQIPPAYVTELQSVYGDDSQTIGSGSAVFFQSFTSEELESVNDILESASKLYLRQYIGRMWDREQDDESIRPGEEVWGVNLIYQRPQNAQEDGPGDLNIVDALNHLVDKPGLLSTVGAALDLFQEDQHYADVMYNAFDDPSVILLHCYQVEDYEAYNGLLVSACRDNGEAVFWIFIQD